MTKPKIWYWAYGSNLNVRHMTRRCPGAKKVAPLSLDHGKLIFRGVADIELMLDAKIWGGLWLITPKDEKILDGLEGVASGLYKKKYLKLRVVTKKGNVETVKCLYYMMTLDGILPPDERYIDTIMDGYRDFGLPVSYLEAALQDSWTRKRPTKYLLKRQARRKERMARDLAFPEEEWKLWETIGE